MTHPAGPHGWPPTAAGLRQAVPALARLLILVALSNVAVLRMLLRRWHGPLSATAVGLLLAACGGGGGDWFLPFWEPGDVQVADVDGDGRPDVITTAQLITSMSHREGYIVIRRQTAPGVFASTRYVVGVNPWKLVVADVDGDGAPDLVMADATTADSSRGVVWLLKQNPASRGEFLPPQRLMETASTPQGIAVGDVNGDNAPDLVFTSQASDVNGATLLAQNPARRGSFLPAAPLDVQDHVEAVVIADLNGDGRKDIVLRRASSVNGIGESTLGVIYQQMGGTLSAWQELPSDQTGIDSRLLAAIDVDRDGTLDIVEYFTPGSAAHESRVTALRQDRRGGNFTRVDSLLPEVAGAGAAVADLDSDGRPDLVVAGDGLDIVPQSAAGAFGSPRNLRLPNPASAIAVAVADLNGDGLNDLIVLFDGDGFHGLYELLQSPGVPGTYLAPRFLD